MLLTDLRVQSVRNLQDAHVSFPKFYTIFAGANGSGKTSYLEAIVVLLQGRSFRAKKLDDVIRFGQTRLQVRGDLTSKSFIKISKERGASISCLKDVHIQTTYDLQQAYPTIVINTESFSLAFHPEERRVFLNWGAFQMDPLFVTTWRAYKHALQQRNRALKERRPRAIIDAFTQEMAVQGDIVAQMHLKFYNAFLVAAKKTLRHLLDTDDIQFEYYQGWPKDEELLDALHDGFTRDAMLGYSSLGPHRSDLIMKIQGAQVQHWLSRGQLKTLVFALHIARAECLVEYGAVVPVILVDDLLAELDLFHGRKILKALENVSKQIFITGIECEHLAELFREKDFTMYEVESGSIREFEAQSENTLGIH